MSYYKSKVYTITFLFFYVINVFIINVSNSQYFVGIDNVTEYVDKIKLITYLLMILSLSFLFRLNKITFFDIFLFVLFLASYYYSRLGLALFLFFIFARYVKFEYILKGFIFSILLGAFFVFVTYCFDLYEYNFVDFSRGADSVVLREALGYKFPTYFPNVLLYVFLSWIALRNKSINWCEIIIIGLVNLGVYVLTDTRTVFYLVNLLLLVVFFIKRFNVDYSTFFLGYIAKIFTIYSFLIFSIISIYLQVSYNSEVEWMSSLNKLLSGRLAYGNYGYVEYGIKLLGQKVDYIDVLDVDSNNKLFVVDSGYLKILLDQGVLLFLSIVLGFILIGKRIVRRNNIYLGIVVIFSLIDVLVNPHLLLLSFNPFIFLLAYYNNKENGM